MVPLKCRFAGARKKKSLENRNARKKMRKKNYGRGIRLREGLFQISNVNP
jgi:hypothetical protein